MVMEKVQENWVRGTPIGRGSFGTVSLAVNKSSGAVFAVKSVERNSCLPHQLEALENEIRILRSLSSPYVVGYLGDGVTVEDAPAGNSFRNLYLEYLPGGTVADLARARKTGADVDDIILKNYSFCIVSALKYLHSKGIVHCDIKSDNVLVGPNCCTAKLADFGSAMEVSPRGRGQTMPNVLPRGSPLWMAPEVIRGECQGPESDVWSLGCTIIEMITGKPAWQDKGLAETLCRIGYSEELPPLPTQLSELGRDFLEKCLRRDPNKRWSCDQLLQHPFISTCSTANSASHSSPRCILDWFSLDSDIEEDDEEIVHTRTSFPPLEERNTDDIETYTSRVKDRIRELASGTGPNWNSDGWVVVRSLESSDAGCCWGEKQEVGTSSAYSELIGVSPAHADSIEIGEVSRRTNEEYSPDSHRSPSQQEEEANNGHNDAVSADHEAGRFLLVFYLLSNFNTQNYTICSQMAILLTYIRNFCYLFLSLDFLVLDISVLLSHYIIVSCSKDGVLLDRCKNFYGCTLDCEKISWSLLWRLLCCLFFLKDLSRLQVNKFPIRNNAKTTRTKQLQGTSNSRTSNVFIWVTKVVFLFLFFFSLNHSKFFVNFDNSKFESLFAPLIQSKLKILHSLPFR